MVPQMDKCLGTDPAEMASAGVQAPSMGPPAMPSKRAKAMAPEGADASSMYDYRGGVQEAAAAAEATFTMSRQRTAYAATGSDMRLNSSVQQQQQQQAWGQQAPPPGARRSSSIGVTAESLVAAQHGSRRVSAPPAVLAAQQQQGLRHRQPLPPLVESPEELQGPAPSHHRQQQQQSTSGLPPLPRELALPRLTGFNATPIPRMGGFLYTHLATGFSFELYPYSAHPEYKQGDVEDPEAGNDLVYCMRNAGSARPEVMVDYAELFEEIRFRPDQIHTLSLNVQSALQGLGGGDEMH
jgi:hypothetical protein